MKVLLRTLLKFFNLWRFKKLSSEFEENFRLSQEMRNKKLFHSL